MRPNIMPGLVLAGGVIIAAVIALLLIGGGGAGSGPLPSQGPPAAVRLFPSAIAGSPQIATHHRRRHGAAGSAAESQYAAAGDRGSVLDTP